LRMAVERRGLTRTGSRAGSSVLKRCAGVGPASARPRRRQTPPHGKAAPTGRRPSILLASGPV
jgi:hypothetical protein